jgi:hypothetical protein
MTRKPPFSVGSFAYSPIHRQLVRVLSRQAAM